MFSLFKVIVPQYYQTQQQQDITSLVQQGAKIVMQSSPAPSSTMQMPQKIYFRPQQQQQHQLVQINNQPQSVNVARMRLPNQPPQKVVQVGNPRMKFGMISTPRGTIIEASPSQSNAQSRPITPGKTIYIIKPSGDGNQIVNQQNNIVRLPVTQGQKVVQSPRTVTNQTNPDPSPPQQQISEGASSSTFVVRKNSDCDDLENSITATAISKSSREPPPLVQCPPRQIQQNARALQTFVRVPGLVPTQPLGNSLIKSPTKYQVIRTGNPQNINLQTRSINRPHPRESAKMLVILNNGEQRLITFTLPKESCTVQELLDQVGIKVGDESIECIENHDSKIDYVVKIGNTASKTEAYDMAKAAENAENHIKQRQQQIMKMKIQSEKETHNKPEVKVPPKYIEGFLAVCKYCGFTGSDHAKCERCQRIFTEEPKRIPQKDGASQLAANNKITPVKVSTIDKKNQLEELQRQHQIKFAISKANTVQRVTRVPVNVKSATSTTATRSKMIRNKKLAVPEIVTLSSDDEDDSDSNQNSSQSKPVSELKMSFEPEILEDLVAGKHSKIVDKFNVSTISERILCLHCVVDSLAYGSSANHDDGCCFFSYIHITIKQQLMQTIKS